MDNPIEQISLLSLGVAFLPVALVVFIFFKWRLPFWVPIYASVRMLGQLLLVGYALQYIFRATTPLVTLLTLLVMVLASGWIALRPVKNKRERLYFRTTACILLGGGSVLILVILAVIDLPAWYYPRYTIPLAGMIFANSMNSVSLAAERIYSELSQGKEYAKARAAALQASLIPVINTFFAVGIVSIPGMMTGQILSGVSPLLAVRYQVVVMCMVFGSAGLSSSLFLASIEGKNFEKCP